MSTPIRDTAQQLPAHITIVTLQSPHPGPAWARPALTSPIFQFDGISSPPALIFKHRSPRNSFILTQPLNQVFKEWRRNTRLSPSAVLECPPTAPLIYTAVAAVEVSKKCFTIFQLAFVKCDSTRRMLLKEPSPKYCENREISLTHPSSSWSGPGVGGCHLTSQ